MPTKPIMNAIWPSSNASSKRDKEFANAFDDPRRSTATQQLAYMQSHALLALEEMSDFSVETRSSVRFLLGENELEA